MVLAVKIVWAGMACALLTTGMLLQTFPRSPAGPDSQKQDVADFVIKDEIKKLQETLRVKGHYQGKVDGVFGLRTRAGLRAYQKAENLTATGQVDLGTAERLGVRPEMTWRNSDHAEGELGREIGRAAGEMNRDKPSAGIRRPVSRAGKTLRKKASKASANQQQQQGQR